LGFIEDTESPDSHPAVANCGIPEETALVYMPQKRPSTVRRGRDAVMPAINSVTVTKSSIISHFPAAWSLVGLTSRPVTKA
jgi:hypothetical protein